MALDADSPVHPEVKAFLDKAFPLGYILIAKEAEPEIDETEGDATQAVAQHFRLTEKDLEERTPWGWICMCVDRLLENLPSPGDVFGEAEDEDDGEGWKKGIPPV